MESISEKVQALIVKSDTSEKGNNNGKLDSKEEINIFNQLVREETQTMQRPLGETLEKLPKWPLYPAMALGLSSFGYLASEALTKEGGGKVGKILKLLAGIGSVYASMFAGVKVANVIWKSDKYKTINDERNKIIQEVENFKRQANSVVPDLTELG